MLEGDTHGPQALRSALFIINSGASSKIRGLRFFNLSQDSNYQKSYSGIFVEHLSIKLDKNRFNDTIPAIKKRLVPPKICSRNIWPIKKKSVLVMLRSRRSVAENFTISISAIVGFRKFR
jgi:hypothetical protein